MLIYNGQVIAGGGTIVLPMTRAEYEANKAVLDTADVWIDLTDEPDQVATADQIAYSVDNVQKSMGYIGDIATKAIAKVEPTDTALYLHAVGTYFINKDGNACKTDVQISVGGAITLGTNCHVVDGVANDINSNLSSLIDTVISSPLSLTTNAQGFVIVDNGLPTKAGYRVIAYYLSNFSSSDFPTTPPTLIYSPGGATYFLGAPNRTYNSISITGIFVKN